MLLIQRGTFANSQNNPNEAILAFEQVLAQDQTSSEAWQGLAQAAPLLQDHARRAKALQMVVGLGRIHNLLGKTNHDSNDPTGFLDVADLCVELQLIREAAVMARTAHRIAPNHPRSRKAVESLRTRLAAEGLPQFLGP